jgi:hypothetical protein
MLSCFCARQRDEVHYFDIWAMDLPPKAVHLMVTRHYTSALVASLVPHPTTPMSLWNFKYDPSHEGTTMIVRLPQSKN